MGKQRPALILKPGREKPILRRHPWVFSGAIESVFGNPSSGDIIDIISSKGEKIAKGAYSHESQIISRIWTWNFEEDINEEFLKERLKKAINGRKNLIISDNFNAFRLVHAESDGFPGLIVDQYADVIVIQIHNWGMEVWRDVIAGFLMELTEIKTIYERSEDEIRSLEGLPPKEGLVLGNDINDEVVIIENGVRYLIDVKNGHKTGFYLDQRANRQDIQDYSYSKEVLDCFSYTGGFTLNALLGGAQEVTCIDSSNNVLALLERNLLLNRLDQSKVKIVSEDVFKQLRIYLV